MKRNRTLRIAVTATLSLLLLIGGLGQTQTIEAADTKVAAIFGIGGLGDQSYNDLVYEGLERAKEDLGVDFDYAEPKEVTDFEVIMRDMSDSGEYDTIICIAFDQLDALSKVCLLYTSRCV